MTEPVLRTEGLTKHYGPTVGIEGLDLTLEPGEILGFLGPNGAGKTTTLRLVMGFLRPTAGRFWLFGEEIAWGQWRHRARIGFLPGDVRLPRRMTGRGLLRFLAGLHSAVDWDWVNALVERLDLDLDRRIRALSRGNLQKLGLVQAMMHRPDLLILDEPTISLDPLVQRTVLEILREMCEAGSTVFFSSHNITEVERICDRVAVVREGHLATVDGIDDLRAGLLAHVQVRLSPGVTAPVWSRIESVVSVERTGDTVTLLVRGRPARLLTLLSNLDVEDLTWERATLEDHFFELYKPSGGGET
jgi:ABC-2 type transport system ATP-binding protein